MVHIKKVALALIMILALASVVSAAPLKKEKNYMSDAGFARWQQFLVSGEWK